MRRFLTILIFNLVCTSSLYATNSPIQCQSPCVPANITPQKCEDMCLTCRTYTTENMATGVQTISNKIMAWQCSVYEGGTADCSCRGTITDSCMAGWYGTAPACTKCPTNATCAGGTRFLCVAGYYQNGSSCARCTSATGNLKATSRAGATSISDCYVPGGTTGSDASGSFEFTSDCNYSI